MVVLRHEEHAFAGKEEQEEREKDLRYPHSLLVISHHLPVPMPLMLLLSPTGVPFALCFRSWSSLPDYIHRLMSSVLRLCTHLRGRRLESLCLGPAKKWVIVADRYSRSRKTLPPGRYALYKTWECMTPRADRQYRANQGSILGGVGGGELGNHRRNN